LYTYGPVAQATLQPTTPTCTAPTAFSSIINLFGAGYVPGPVKIWITGSDGITSNTLYLFFAGSLNAATQDLASGRLFYAYGGDGSDDSDAVLEYTSAGNAIRSLPNTAGFQGAFDGTTGYFVTGGTGGVGWYDTTSGTSINSVRMGIAQNSLTYNLAVNGGNVCAVQTAEGTLSFANEAPAGPQPTAKVASGLNQPTAVVMPSPTSAVVFTRGDNTLHWIDFSGSSAVVTGTLVLDKFTAYDANFKAKYPTTGGWSALIVGNTIGVMGLAVNADGSISRLLALVDNPSKTLTSTGYVTLPQGTVQIAVDAGNAAFAAEYPDASGPSPVTRVVRVNPQTGVVTKLNATSTLVPASGFLVTVNSELAFFVQGNHDLQPNQ
jgi:hypothetical protein